MHHTFDNLIMLPVMMIMLTVFLRALLNAVHPGLGDAVLKGMKKLAMLLIKGIAWIFMKLLSLFGIDWIQKKLPGRRT